MNPLAAQTEQTTEPAQSPRPANPAAATPPASGAVFESPTMPGVIMMAPIPDAPAPSAEKPASTAPALGTGAVFESPTMPGVIMMAPIPDALAPSPARAVGKIQKAPAVAAPAPKPAPAPSLPVTAGGSPNDRALLVQAFAAAKKGDWNRALRLTDQVQNHAAGTLIDWLRLSEAPDASFEELDGFLKTHADWPRRDALLAHAEKALPDSMNPKLIVDWFGERTPVSATGMVRLGEAFIDLGQLDKGVELIRKAWIQGNFGAADEQEMLRAHSDVIGEAHHRARLDQLFAHEDLVAAKRQMTRVDADARRIADARLRLRASPAAVKAILASVPDELQTNPGFLYDAARALRQRGFEEDAWTLLAKAPAGKAVNDAPESWWSERQQLVRGAMKAGRYDLAYSLASKHAQDSGTSLYEAEFMAGWIALRFLHKPEVALGHFQSLAKAVTMPISVARAYYWLGRTEEELKHPLQAIAQYSRAATNPETFYGQLALARVEDAPMLHIRSDGDYTTAADELSFEADDRIGAIRALAQVGDRSLMRLFAIRVANEPRDPKHLELLAQLMLSLNDRAMDVRIGKIASYNNVMLPSHLTPVLPLPRPAGNVTGPEAALVLGVTRQESEFDANAVSSAGARGLMQLMPATAKQMAKTYRIAYRPNDLTNPQYNMQLGMATLENYLEYWGGSYVLAIAAYNAGTGNVLKWVDAFGDPRDPTVDPIDWIELIPFSETRNYVQRVLENVELYRNRLSGGDQKLAILSDLYRPKNPNVLVVKYQPSAPVDVPIPVRKPTQASVVE